MKKITKSKKTTRKMLRWLVCAVVLVGITVTNSNAQLTGTFTIPGSYATIAAAITDLNTQGVGAGGATFNVAAGYTETAPVGGYALGSVVLNASLSAANPLTIQTAGGGANPLITAPVGTIAPSTAGGTGDAIFNMNGVDYVTINGIDLVDPVSHTTTTTQMEWGYGLFKRTASLPNDGCQYNTIENCVITLQRTNIYSQAIIMDNRVYNSTTQLTPSTASDANSFNHFYTNTFLNVNTGMWIRGYNSSSTVTTLWDNGNDIGGSSSATGNQFLSWGGTSTAYGIYAYNQLNGNYQYNNFNNYNAGANGGVVATAGTLYCIYSYNSSLLTDVWMNTTASNNTVLLTGGAGSASLYGLYIYYNAGNENVNNNTVQWATTGTSTGSFYGIYNYYGTGSAAGGAGKTSNCNNNLVGNCSFANSTGTVYGIYSYYQGQQTANFHDNQVVNLTRTAHTTGTTYLLACYASPNYNVAGYVTNCYNNTINNITCGTIASSSTLYCYYSMGGNYTFNMYNNTCTNVTNAGTGTIYGMYCYYYANQVNIYNNTVSNITLNTNLSVAGGGTIYGIYDYYYYGANTNYYNNTITGLKSGGSTASVYGWYKYYNGGNFTAHHNKITNIQNNSTLAGASNIYGVYEYAYAGANANAGTLWYDNLISVGNNTAGASTNSLSSGGCHGMYLTTGTGRVDQIYNNTIMTFGNSAQSAYGATCIFQGATTVLMDLRNNILINKADNTNGAPASKVCCVRPTSNVLSTTFNGTTTNNNNYYLPSTNSTYRYLVYNGTTGYQTMAAWNAASSMDVNSFSENTTLLSTDYTNANFLKVDPTVSTQCESGGQVIPAITNDYFGNIRFGNTGYIGTGTSYDIGANEFEGTTPAPSVSGPTVPTNVCTPGTTTTISATVTTGTGTITGATLNYNNGSPGSVAMTNTSGNTWTAVIPVGTPGVIVTWSIIATNSALYTSAINGTSYTYLPLTGYTAVSSASVNPVCAGGSTTLSTLLNGSQTLPTGYCTPSNTVNATYFLNNFSTTGGITNITNNNSGFSTAGYGNFTSMVVTQQPGGTVNFSISGNSTNTMGMAIFVDWNRNGTFDAGEQMYASGAYVNSASGSFVVPANASAGATRMRVVIDGNSSAPTSCDLSSYEESEDYSFNVRTPATANSWFDGTSVVGTTSTLAVSPASNTTYTNFLTAAGCTVSGSSSPLAPSVAVVVTPIPTAPTSTSTTQCGTLVPAANVTSTSGTPTPIFKWYNAASGGTLLQTSTSTTYTTTVASTTTFYVTEAAGLCESSPRTAVTVTVNLPDPIVATASTTSFCVNSPVTLGYTQALSNNLYNVFSWSGAAGSGASTPVAGSPAVITPSVAATYTYTLTATETSSGCATTSTISVTANPGPFINTPVATPSTVCSGGPVNLTATTNIISGGTVAIGTGIVTNAITAYPSPFGQYYGSAHEQYLILASELTAASVYSGNLTSIAWNLAAGYTYAALSNFQVNIAPTALTALTTSIVSTGFTNVVPSGTYTPPNAIGYATINFTTPFNWNGTSNIIVDVSFSNCSVCNGTSSCTTSFTDNGSVNQTTTTFASTVDIHADGNCTINSFAPSTTGTTYTQRPNMKFGCQTVATGAGAATWTWNPGNINGNIVTVNPTSTTTYTVSANSGACTSTLSTPVTVLPLPTAPTATNSLQCGTLVPTAFVTSTTGAPTPTFRWYTAATAGTLLQTSTSTTYTTNVSATTTFYVAEVSGICESSRTPVLVSVNAPDAIIATASATPICVNTSVTLGYTQALSDNIYNVFSWSGAAGSGASIPVSGSSVSITPNVAGTYTYTLTASETSTGCATVSTVAVTANPGPNINGGTATPSTVCSGSPSTLAAYALTTGSQTLPTGYCSASNTTNTTYGIANFSTTGGTTNVTNNGSGFSTGGYGDFTSTMTVTQLTGSTVSFSITGLGSGLTYGYAVYVDWNRNGSFTDAGEIMYSSGAYIASTSGTFTVPATATLGATRMRIVADYLNTAPPSCDVSTYEETEDYTFNVQANGSGSVVWTWNPGNLNGNIVTVNPTSTTTYTVYANGGGCISTLYTTVNMLPLPSAPLAANSTQCGAGIPTASISSTATTGILGNGQFNWYNASTAGTLQQGPPSTFQTYYTNNFSTGAGAGILSGVAAISGGILTLYPNTTSQQGGLTIPASGTTTTRLQVDFDGTTVGSSVSNMADGFSYSYANDADATLTTGQEQGTGSKLRISFDAYGTVNPNVQGIYLLYNETGTSFNSTDPAPVLAYSGNTSWLNSGSMHYTITVNASGQLTLVIGSTTIFNNVQLPPAYLSADKSTWKHVIAGRTGGVSMSTSIDNLVIQTSVPSAGSPTYLSLINNTTTWYVSETGMNGCPSPRTAVTETVNQPDAIQAVASTTAICGAGSTVLSFNQTSTVNGNVYTSSTWSASPTLGSGMTSSVAGGALPGTTSVTPTANGNYIYTVIAHDSVQNCNALSTVNVGKGVNPTMTTVTSTPPSTCPGGVTQLNAGTFVGGSLTTGLLGGNGSSGNGFNITATNNVTIHYFSMSSTTSSSAQIWYIAGGFAGPTLSSSTGWTLLGTAPIAVGTPALINVDCNVTIPAGQTYGFVVVSNGSNSYTNGTTFGNTWASDANITVQEGCGGSGYGGTFSLTNSVRDFNGTITYSYGDPNLVYTWSPSTGLSSPTILNPMATVATTTTYSVTATNLAGCSSSGSVTVSTNPLTAGPLTLGGTTCVGTQTVTAHPISGGIPYSYSWTQDGSPYAGTTATVNTAAGTHTYACTITDGCGTNASSSLSVTTYSLASVTPGTIGLCAGNSANVTALPNGADSYIWSGGSSATTQSITVSTATTFTVTVSQGSGTCITTATATSSVQPLPSITTLTASPTTVCNGGNSALHVTGNSNIVPSAYCVPAISSGCGIDYITNVTLGSINRTSTCDNLSLANGYSYFGATPTTTMTAGSVYPLSVTTGGDTEGAMAWIDFNQDGLFSSSEIVLPGAYAGTNPATYSGTFTVPSSAYNGVTRLRVRCNYASSPSSLTGDPSCAASTFGEVEDYSVTITGGVDPLGYTWSPSTFLPVQTGSSITATAVTSPTTYTVTATNGPGCTITSTVSVGVTQPSIAPTSLNGATAFCVGGSATLTQSGGSLGTGAYWQWYSNPTFTTTVGPQLTTANASITVSPTTTKTYYLRAEGTTGPCAAIVTGPSSGVTVTISPAPIGSTSNATICSGSATNIGVSSNIAGSTFTWTTSLLTGSVSGNTAGSGSTIAQTLTNGSNSATGSVRYTITPTSPLGCPGSTFLSNVTVNPTPIGSNTTGDEYLCDSSSTNLVLSATTTSSFNWTAVPSSGSITGSNSCTTGCGSTIGDFLVNGGNSDGTVVYTITPTSTAGCAGSSFTATETIGAYPLTSVSAGVTTLCSGSSTNISISSGLTSIDYSWTTVVLSGTVTGWTDCLSGGCGTSITDTLLNTGTTDAVVEYTIYPISTTLGCPGNTIVVDVTVHPTPDVSTALSGVICSGSSTNLSLTSSVTGTSYSWTASGSSGSVTGYSGCSSGCGSSIVQTLNNTGNADGTVNYTITPTASGCAGSTFTSTQTVGATPVGSAINNTVICNGGPANVALNSTVSGTTFTWTSSVLTGSVLSHGSCSSGCAAAITEILTNTGPVHSVVEYTVTPTSATGCTGSNFTVDVTVGATPATPGAIAGPNAVCQVSSTIYSITAVPEATTYVWTVPSPATITSGQGSTAIHVTIPAGTVVGNVTVTASNSCGASGVSTLAIAKKPGTPGAISGPTSVCGQTTASYSISPVFGATSYAWIVPSGMTIASGSGTTGITVNVGSAFIIGSISVSAVNNCGNIPGVSISVTGHVPGIPGSITGPASVCGISTLNYSCATTPGATGYFWTAPSGMSIIGGQGTTSVTVSNPGGFTSGSITVSATDICGTGTAKALALNITATQPGLISGPTVTCGLTTATYSVAAVAGSTGYNWTLPTGITMAANNGASIDVNISGTFSTGNISLTSTNGCSTSAARLLTVSKLEPTPGTITGPASVCGMTTENYSIAAVAGATSYNWIVPAGMTIASGNGTTQITVTQSGLTMAAGTVKVAAINTCGTSAYKTLAIGACAEAIGMGSATEATGNAFSDLYPNPATKEFTIDVTTETDKEIVVEVYDILGNLLIHEKHQMVTGGVNTIKTNIEDYNNGIYFVRLTDTDNNVLYTQRVIKQ